MRIGWFTNNRSRDYNRVSASIWIRCYQLLDYLEQLGIHSVLDDPEAEIDIAVFVRWQDDDALSLARRLRGRGVKIVYDLVVNYFDETDHADFTERETNPVERYHVEEALHMAAAADAITCASPFIAARASQVHPHAVAISDSIDTRHFNRRKMPWSFFRPRLRAIWSGSEAKVYEMAPILDVLRRHQLGLTLVTQTDRHGTPPPLKDARGQAYPYRFRPWRYETFPRTILRGEVCVVHRELDNPYNKGHSLFKIGVFMAQGIPVIASPVPSYRQVLGDPGAGMLCETLDDWDDALSLITGNRRILQQWSAEARRRIEPFTTARIVEQYTALFNTLKG
ncbi:MAG: glycosyltransferase [Chloroflexi bacterium]|nr:glycosyltransferase [Chloroflexota bacterium]